jgi:conjugal transfer/entry exclusion protein
VERSQGASEPSGAAGANQLLALSTKQQLQLQNLMAAEFREQSMERARRAQAEIEARAATRRFLGTGKAYSPRVSRCRRRGAPAPPGSLAAPFPQSERNAGYG